MLTFLILRNVKSYRVYIGNEKGGKQSPYFTEVIWRRQEIK